MKHYYKECKTLNGINTYLRSIGCEDYQLDKETRNRVNDIDYFDTDCWDDSSETTGTSITWYNDYGTYTVFVTKYTKEDIENDNY